LSSLLSKVSVRQFSVPERVGICPDVLALPLTEARLLLASAGWKAEVRRTEPRYRRHQAEKSSPVEYVVNQRQLVDNMVLLTTAIKCRKEAFWGMAFEINKDECVGCGTCQANCPVGAIKDADGKFAIAADECVECGTCAANCPVGAIKG